MKWSRDTRHSPKNRKTWGFLSFLPSASSSSSVCPVYHLLLLFLLLFCTGMERNKKLHSLLPSQKNTTNSYRPKQPPSPPSPATGQLPPPQCFQTQPASSHPMTSNSSNIMASPSSSSSSKAQSRDNSFSQILFPIIASAIIICSFVYSAAAVSDSHLPVNQTFQPAQQLRRLKRVNAYLKKINKPAVKTIQAIILSCFINS